MQNEVECFFCVFCETYKSKKCTTQEEQWTFLNFQNRKNLIEIRFFGTSVVNKAKSLSEHIEKYGIVVN